MRFLAVDDEPLMLDGLVSALRGARPEAEVLPFRWPEDDLEELKKQPADVSFQMFIRDRGTSNLRAYLRKMAVDGYIFQLDMGAVLELVKLLRSVSSNVNQIARRCNSTHNLYAQDVEDLRQGYMEIWQGGDDLLKKFETL